MPTEKAKGVSIYVKLSIALLILFTATAITALFIADFEGRIIRITSTFFIFATFITLTMLDTSVWRKPSWYAPAATVANSYFLGLTLVVTWVTPLHGYDYKVTYVQEDLGLTLTGVFFGTLILTRAALGLAELLMRNFDTTPSGIQKSLIASAVSFFFVAISFSLPYIFTAFNLDTPSLYWKFATACVILAGLFVSVSMLLKWNHHQERVKADRLANPERYAPTVAPLQNVTQQVQVPRPPAPPAWTQQPQQESALPEAPQAGAMPVDLPPPPSAPAQE